MHSFPNYYYYLIFNFCCLLYISNLLGSSSGRQLYMQYGMFYMHRCELSGGSQTHSPTHQTPHTDSSKTCHTAYAAVSLRMNPRGSKHVGDNRNLKLNINLENCAFRWFMLYNYSDLLRFISKWFS